MIILRNITLPRSISYLLFSMLFCVVFLPVQATAQDYSEFDIGKELTSPSKDFKRAVKEGVKAGDTKSYYFMGKLVDEYEIISSNLAADDAFGWYLIAAKHGNIEAQYHIAKYVLDLYENSETHESRQKYATPEENAEDPNRYKEKLDSIGISKFEAVTWLHMAGVDNSPDAALLLSKIYEEGWVVPKSRKMAREWLMKGVEANHPESIARHGRAMIYGNLGITKNITLGISTLSQAANLGDNDSLKDLGDLYLRGIEIEKDREKAAQYYRKCALAYHLKSASIGFFCRVYLVDILLENQDYVTAYAWLYAGHHEYRSGKQLEQTTSLRSEEDETKFEGKLTENDKNEAIAMARECINSKFKSCKL